MTQYNEISYFKDFPVFELGRMIQNIDRFDTEVMNPDKKQAEDAISKAEEITEKIIEENL